ncbi:MAG: sulfite exporter TauE/SafE family protein [Solobacterium sp.]|nr:sulfite exporter TauE/SafE family protein [Solobacterium sp.]
MLYLIVSLFASIIGAICGIGGGVIIKPVLDMVSSDGASVINFLSGCTVLSMSLYSVGKELLGGKTNINYKQMVPLALGSAAGGICGNTLFNTLKNQFAEPRIISGIQAICLAAVVFLSMLYTLKKDSIKNLKIDNMAVSAVIGFALGTMSSFLGIGGGPINLVVLYFFFSMNTKEAAFNSIFVILFGQITNLGKTILTHTVPEFNTLTLVLMVCGGLLGGIIGRTMNKKIDGKTVEKLFLGAMVLILVICALNIKKYLFV